MTNPILRANYTYKEIADKLNISLNTVKKHLKNIQVKQETVLSMEKC
jgi:DNA-binding CsgD family transcriptional regulator